MPYPAGAAPTGGDRARAYDAGGTACRHGHAPTRNPTLHPRWGMVPSASNAVLGAVVLALVIGLAWWWFPGPWAAALSILAGLGLVVSGLIQLALGHRRGCWAQRTVRWWLGPPGAMIDPFDIG